MVTASPIRVTRLLQFCDGTPTLTTDLTRAIVPAATQAEGQ